jgi:hypothetical protein
MLAMKRLLVLLACIDFCARMLYDSGRDAGFTETCVCCEHGECDKVSKKTFPPLPITLKIRGKGVVEEPETKDTRPEIKYPSGDDDL